MTSDLSKKLRKAAEREEDDDHLLDYERAKLVADFEEEYPDPHAVFGMEDYPVNGSITDKYVFIVFDLT